MLALRKGETNFCPIFYNLRILITSCVGCLQKKYSIIVSFVNAGVVKAIIFLVGGKSIFGLSSIFIFRVIQFSVKKIPAGIYCVIINSVKISTWKAMIYVRALRNVLCSLIVRFIWYPIRETAHITIEHFQVS